MKKPRLIPQVRLFWEYDQALAFSARIGPRIGARIGAAWGDIRLKGFILIRLDNARA